MENTQTTTVKTNTLSLSAILPISAFVIPLFVSGPQLLTGSLVNAFLLLAVMKKIDRRSQIAVAMAPSVGALFNGVLFGTFTPLLVFLMPFIWAGNLLFMHVFAMISRKFERISAIIAGAALKSFVLFAGALFLFKSSLIPQTLVNAMGMMQFVTALIGGFGALAIMIYLTAHHDRH